MTDYGVFILSYDRCGNIKTIDSLRRGGYTGEIYIICGNDDPELSDYEREYGQYLLVFDKDKYMRAVDTIDDNGNRDCVVYARHAVFDIAREMGIDFFLMLDDDYVDFEEREVSGTKLLTHRIKDLDTAFAVTFDFLISSDADVVAWAQGGDFLGGASGSKFKQGILRKAMNSFFCRTDRPLDFIGSTNEDVNYYVNGDMAGRLILTVTDANIRQTATQKSEGGLTDIYLRDGTYTKSLYPVICQPSCVKVAEMRANHTRIHHQISWENCAPMIMSEKYKKV